MGGGEVRVERRAHELLRRPRGPLRHAEVVGNKPGDRVGEPRDGHDVVGKADGQRLRSADALPAHAQPHCPTDADEPRQPPGRHPRRQALGSSGQPQNGVLGEDPDVASQRQLKTAAKAVSVDLRNDEAVQPLQPDKCLLLQRVEVPGHAFRGEHAQIEARTERATLPAHHNDLRLVALHSGDGIDQAGHPLQVHRIELPGPRQHDLGYVADPAHLHCCHAADPVTARPAPPTCLRTASRVRTTARGLTCCWRRTTSPSSPTAPTVSAPAGAATPRSARWWRSGRERTGSSRETSPTASGRLIMI